MPDDWCDSETDGDCDAADEDYSSFADPGDDEHRMQLRYRILSEGDIRRRQEDDTATTASVLSISEVEAAILLRHFNWDVTKANEEFFADQERIRKSLGLFNKPLVGIHDAGHKRKSKCGICFDFHPRNEISVLSCGHPFCNDCWRCYIETSIADGSGCLTLRCPEPPCGAAVGQDMVEKLAPAEAKKKYSNYVIRSFVESTGTTKWCPAPDCDLAIELISNISPENFDVSCTCTHNFCWNCCEEPHRPVDCKTVSEWILKNNSESENATWVLANTKPCPACNKSIEKNAGCNHMTCRCGHHFCWVCLAPTAAHSSCNRFDGSQKTGAAYDEEIRRRAKKALNRYIHYYERWAGNDSSWKKATASLREMEEQQMEVLSFKYKATANELGFLAEAWRQIIDGRRVLKWTYAFGFYRSPELPEKKKELFEYSQGEAEDWLEKLHHCVETKLLKYVEKDSSSEEFNEFKKMVEGLTKASRDYFMNLIRAVEMMGLHQTSGPFP